jgi:hypothetical protein
MVALPRPFFASIAPVLFAAALAACGGTSFTSAGTGGATSGSTTAGPTGSGGSGSGATGGGGSGATGGGGSDTSATAGVGGAGGMGVAASTSETSTTGSGGGFVCPPAQPQEGSACDGVGSCAYTDPVICCNLQVECSGGSWHVVEKMCSAPTCPPNLPANGSPCGCDEVCEYGSCANAGAVSATCSGGHWSTVPAACTLCGNTACDPGQVCIEKVKSGVVETACVMDPCAGNPLECSCAKPAVCPEEAYSCSTAGSTVTCTAL